MIKRNKKEKPEGRGRLVACIVLGLFVVVGVCVGLSIGYNALKAVWQEQCRVADRELDVVITSGKMVHPDVVTLHFGLTNGANLATIPFARLRANLLERVPNIRDLHIERRLPNRVTVDVIEREPLVRVTSDASRGETGRVADTEGVVFRFSHNTSLLPLVRETVDTPTPPGRKLVGNAAAALRLVEVAADLPDIRVLEVDTRHPDYLLVTLGTYDRAKIAWDHMLENSRLARESLRRQLRHLSQAIATRLTPRTTLWIATDWGEGGRIYNSDSSRSGNQ